MPLAQLHTKTMFAQRLLQYTAPYHLTTPLLQHSSWATMLQTLCTGQKLSSAPSHLQCQICMDWSKTGAFTLAADFVCLPILSTVSHSIHYDVMTP